MPVAAGDRKRALAAANYSGNVNTVGGNKQAVQKYIQNQEKEDLISAQISMVEYYDPFEQWLKSNLKK